MQARIFTTPAKHDNARTQLEVEVRKILVIGQVRTNEMRVVSSLSQSIVRINATFSLFYCNKICPTDDDGSHTAHLNFVT